MNIGNRADKYYIKGNYITTLQRTKATFYIKHIKAKTYKFVLTNFLYFSGIQEYLQCIAQSIMYIICRPNRVYRTRNTAPKVCAFKYFHVHSHTVLYTQKISKEKKTPPPTPSPLPLAPCSNKPLYSITL